MLLQAGRTTCALLFVNQLAQGLRHLREEGEDGDASMAANASGTETSLRSCADRVGHECVGAQHVQLCHSQQLARIVCATPCTRIHYPKGAGGSQVRRLQHRSHLILFGPAVQLDLEILQITRF